MTGARPRSRMSQGPAQGPADRPAPDPDMPAARFAELRALVERALDASPREREALLAEVAQRDPDLVAHACRILQADATATREAFLVPPATTASARTARGTPAELAPGARIAGYLVEAPLAAGGGGTVYVARQESTGRRVAFKILSVGAFSAAHHRRFEAEARILARLGHPGIAQVFDAGLWQAAGLSLPWFAMELVEDGRTILEYADGESLSTRERVQLAVQVCDAVHHGHVKGVVHRDLKPGNLLVDRGGRPRVIDFGVARALDDELRGDEPRTAQGLLVGTLAWMSPEQLAGRPSDVDVRTDVHALGLVFYVLVVGQAPWDLGSGSLADVTAAVCGRPARHPAGRRPELRGDLSNVLLKALEKEPARRYASAAALGADLERWLERRPVEAAPASLAHQARLFARRNRVLVASSLVVLAVTLGAAALSIDWALRAQGAEQRAASLFGTLLDHSLDATFDFSLRAGKLPGGTALSREMVEASLADLEQLAAQAEGNLDLAARIGLARLRLGDVLGNPSGPNLGDASAARAQFDAALAVASRLTTVDPEHLPAVRLGALARRRLGELAFHEGREGHGRDALHAAREQIEAALRSHPDTSSLRLDLASTHDKLATAEGRAGDHEAAGRHAALAIAGYEQAALENSLPPAEAALAVAGVRLTLAGLHYLAGRHAEALETYRATADALDPLVDQDPENVPLRDKAGWARMWSGTTLSTMKRPAEAAVELSAALESYRQLARLDPDNVNPPVRVAHIAFSLAQIERDAGDVPAARAWYDEALAALDPLEVSGRLPGSLAALPARVRAELRALDATGASN